MSSTETNETSVETENIATAEVTENTQTAEAKPETVEVTNEKPAAPAPRIAESALEASYDDLPPLSTISASTGNFAENADGSTAGTGEQRAIPRRGLGRSTGKTNTGGSDLSSIGVVENPAETTEAVSGKFANGYANEFIPPVSARTQEAKLDPERERKNLEERRQQRTTNATGTAGTAGTAGETAGTAPRESREHREREERGNRRDRGNRGERGDRAGERREFFGQRREDRAGEWSPNGNVKPAGGTAGNTAGTGNRPGKPGKVHLDAPETPVQPKESLWSKIKEFFASLFGGAKEENTSPASTGNNRDKHHHGSHGSHGGAGGHHHHGGTGGSGNGAGGNRGGRHRGGRGRNRNRHRQ